MKKHYRTDKTGAVGYQEFPAIRKEEAVVKSSWQNMCSAVLNGLATHRVVGEAFVDHAHGLEHVTTIEYNWLAQFA
ncbi:hypothetical protein HVA01_32270 [Halovibrio variabilis]|uniref:Uncharacterized protein n=1 Tax=Halovibrio variabilis TaxID=31910 RepID=A0A511UUF3_9GAMM|nr:hypothetical protein HVA01_32270 [Halovibrio variabilis]